MTSFHAEFLDSFRRTRGVTWSILGTAVTFLAFVVPTKDSAGNEAAVTFKWLLPLGIATAMIINTFWDLALRALKEAKPNPPKVINCREGLAGNVALLLLEEHSGFFIDQSIGLYALENDFEVLVGYGRVLNIQENKKIQVIVMADLQSDPQFWPRVRNNDTNILGNMLVKPGIPYSALPANRPAL